MQNPNALIAMAQVSQNSDNPYVVFCEYIKYCIFTNDKDVLSIKNIRELTEKEFGIILPYHIILKCLEQLKDDEFISFINNNQIRRIGEFDIKSFDEERNNYKKIEDSLVNSLIKYVSEHNKIWDKNYARDCILNVLDRNGLAYDIFMYNGVLKNFDNQKIFTPKNSDELSSNNEDIQVLNNDAESLYPDKFYVGNFINKVIKEKGKEFEYLNQVCKGLMLCIGTYQLTDTNNLNIKGTKFFFDTKLIIRLLGCTGEAAKESAQELMKLIQSNGGKIFYFPQTRLEIEKAFDNAIACLCQNNPIKDREMYLFASKSANSIRILKTKRNEFEKELNALDIHKIDNQNFVDDIERLSYGFDYNDFQQYMRIHLDWEDFVIENDAKSIWETHMLREGNYDDYCGTSKCLPVFVTTNAKLIEVVLSYRRNRPHNKGIRCWKSNRLPVITDMRLMCRLWNPSSQADNLAYLYLTSNVVAAQQPSERYYNKIKELAMQFIENNVAYSDIYLPSFFDDNITEKIFEVTKGNEDLLTISNFTVTIQELYSMQVRDEQDKKQEVINERDDIRGKYQSQTQSIIHDAIERNKNVFSVWIFLILQWAIVINVISVSICAIISLLYSKWSIMLVAVIPALITLFEKFVASNFIRKKLLKKFIPIIEKDFNKKIERNLGNLELKYREEIISGVKENNKLWKKYQEIVNS